MDINTDIVDAFKPLGETISFELAPESRVEFIKAHAPLELNSKKLMSQFKKDIFLIVSLRILRM